MGVGSYRPREFNFHRFCFGGNRGLCVAPTDQPPSLVCCVIRSVLFRLGKYFLAAAFAGPGAAWLFARTGSWTKVFWAMIVCDLLAAFMALLWLKPMAARAVRNSERTTSVADMRAPIKTRGVA